MHSSDYFSEIYVSIARYFPFSTMEDFIGRVAMGESWANLRDDELVEKGLHGSEAALVQLYGRYRPRIMGYAYRMTGCRDQAEDVFQETFTYFFEHLREYVPQGRLAGYLFKIAHRFVLKQARFRRRARIDLRSGRDCVLAGEDGSFEEPSREEQLHRMVGALALPLREVAVLRLHQRLSYAQVAHILGIGEATARSRMRYAIQAIRKMRREVMG